jgi:hypothetical protein
MRAVNRATARLWEHRLPACSSRQLAANLVFSQWRWIRDFALRANCIWPAAKCYRLAAYAPQSYS